MSTISALNTQRPSLPSPPPNPTTTSKPNREASSAQPQTPQSPSQPTASSTGRTSPVDIPGTNSAKSFPTPANSVHGNTLQSETAESAPTMTDTSDIRDFADFSLKRKREVDDVGENKDQKKAHVEGARATIGIEDLHIDVGNKYLHCRTPHLPSKPSLSQDLFALYNLDAIAATVARELPDGSKHKLRKTYKGKIKDLGLHGKFDVSVRQDDAPDSFMAMLRAPEEEWNHLNRAGKEIERGLGNNLLAMLPSATTMAKGNIPKGLWDGSVLGEMEVGESKKGTPVPTSAPAKSTPTPNSKGLGGSVPPAQQQQIRAQKVDAARPKRSIKKRTYDDSTFEGYGEGYVDDEMEAGGYSTGDGDERGQSQKRRKKTAASHGPYGGGGGSMRQSSYGPGMVGA